jgi:hypothetical protein
MRIELSPKSTHGCPNTIFSSLSFSPSHQAPSFLEKLACLRQESVLATLSSFGCLPSVHLQAPSFLEKLGCLRQKPVLAIPEAPTQLRPPSELQAAADRRLSRLKLHPPPADTTAV